MEHRNLEPIPDEGAALLVRNHVSFVDALSIAGSVRRPIRFVMYYKIYRLPVLNFTSVPPRDSDCRKRNADIGDLRKGLHANCPVPEGRRVGVCIFPEGKSTADGG